MKNQISILNIAGAAFSASLMVFSYFLPSLNAFRHAKIRVLENNKVQIPQKQQILKCNDKVFLPALVTTTPSIFVNQETTSPEQITSLGSQQEHQSTQLAAQSEDKCNVHSGSNVCPKNLEYFTKKPRPKDRPEECYTCENLITCVCLVEK